MTENTNMQAKITSALQKIIGLFQSGDVPKAIAIATFPPFDVPSSRWSLANRIIMATTGTSDARGWQQWQQAGRYVRSGEKAFYILAPRMVKKKERDEVKESSEAEESYFCAGFVSVAVFAMEQTDGEPPAYKKLELPELPFMEKAREWGIEVKPVAFQGSWRGSYHPNAEKEEIRLATPHEKTFFHELSHAAHKRVKGYLHGGQDARQEIVAELAAQTIAQLAGTEMESTLGNSYEYIKGYATRLNKDVGKACLSVVAEVGKVLAMILG